MNLNENARSLHRFGYMPEEASFLAIAALHSGYFLRRQFLTFVGGTKGWKDVALLEKLRARHHVRAAVYRQNRMVFHLCAKALYAALGDPDNRNRRERRPLTIKVKLMALDFVLDHRQYGFLATEREKVNYFTSQGAKPEDFPARWYGGEGAVAKYFVDKFPIFLPGNDSPGAFPAGFCYIDEGQQSTQGFATYLEHYRGLLKALPHSRVVYVAAGDRLLEEARQTFGRVCGDGTSQREDPVRAALLRYFRLRQQVESRNFSGLKTADILAHRDARLRFASPEYESLFRLWMEHGDAAVQSKPARPSPSKPVIHAEFSTYVLPHDYDLFGTLVSAA